MCVCVCLCVCVCTCVWCVYVEHVTRVSVHVRGNMHACKWSIKQYMFVIEAWLVCMSCVIVCVRVCVCVYAHVFGVSM